MSVQGKHEKNKRETMDAKERLGRIEETRRELLAAIRHREAEMDSEPRPVFARSRLLSIIRGKNNPSQN
jgi:hypothetical protein